MLPGIRLLFITFGFCLCLLSPESKINQTKTLNFLGMLHNQNHVEETSWEHENVSLCGINPGQTL